MRTNFLLAILAGTAMLAACAKETPVNQENAPAGKMTLEANVAGTQEVKAAFDDVTVDEWTFSFETNDQLTVKNTENANKYSFTKQDGGNFTSDDATPTSATATWHAIYPDMGSNSSISFLNQTGDAASAAALYVLAGSQTDVAAGTGSLSVSMAPQVAILKIILNTGSCLLNIKTKGSSKFFTGLTPDFSGSSVSFTHTEADYYYSAYLLNTSTAGTYYVCVPSGCQIEIYNGTTKLKSSTSGLTAGKYYTITNSPYALPYLFSVSSTKKVQFTKGNLYRYNKSSWAIEDSQISYPTSWDENHVGHLFFADSYEYSSKTYAASYSSTNRSTSDGLFNSSHKISLSGDSANGSIYFNLSREQYEYLFKTRNKATSLYKTNVTVGSVSACLIIAPDDFTGSIESSYASVAAVTNAGLVCLPPAGHRSGTTISSLSYYYWTSVTGTQAAYGNAIDYTPTSETVSYTNSLNRNYGCPVRLVL